MASLTMWTNAYAERFVLTARTEVTDPMLISGQRHLRTILAQYVAHYNGRHPHRSRQLHPPRPDHPAADLPQERIKRRPILGSLINEYERAHKSQGQHQWPSSGTPHGVCRWGTYPGRKIRSTERTVSVTRSRSRVE